VWNINAERRLNMGCKKKMKPKTGAKPIKKGK